MSSINIDDWKDKMEAFLISPIRILMDAEDFGVALILLCLIGTDCLGGYYAGKMATKDSFEKFMKEYFPAAYAQHARYIFESLRSGLAHDYVVKKPKGLNEVPFILHGSKCLAVHLTSCTQGKDYPVFFCSEAFANDFLAVWNQYVKDLFGSQRLIPNLVSRLNDHKRGYLTVGPISDFLRP